MSEKELYFISIADDSKKIGAILVESNETIEADITRIDPIGQDVIDMGIGVWHTIEDMKEKGYA